jgi:galactonate dehydratase
VKAGFNALKFDPFPGPWRTYVDDEDLELAAAKVAAVREAVGPRVEVLVEVHRRLAPWKAIKVGQMIEKYRPYWFEEPCPPENIPAIAEVKQHVRIPITVGEALYGRAGFREVFETRAADIINPDISNTGGILEITQIAAWADTYHMGVSPHGANSAAVSFAAGVQASAVMPNFLIYEYPSEAAKVSNDISVKPMVPQGSYVELPTDPGIGLDLDEKKLAKYAYKQRPKRDIRTVETERKFH